MENGVLGDKKVSGGAIISVMNAEATRRGFSRTHAPYDVDVAATVAEHGKANAEPGPRIFDYHM